MLLYAALCFISQCIKECIHAQMSHCCTTGIVKMLTLLTGSLPLLSQPKYTFFQSFILDYHDEICFELAQFPL